MPLSAQAKTHSPCLKGGTLLEDGCAIFFRMSRFSWGPSGDTRVAFPHSSQVAVVVELLDHANEKRPLLVATTHLKAEKSHAGEKVRQEQAALLCSIIEAKQDSAAARVGHHVPALLCLDANAAPVAAEYPAHFYEELQRRGTWGSCYGSFPLCADNEPALTTCKARLPRGSLHGGALSLKKHTIDYILHTRGLQPIARLAIPGADDPEHADPLDETFALPSDRYPSDHFMLMSVCRYSNELPMATRHPRTF